MKGYFTPVEFPELETPKTETKPATTTSPSGPQLNEEVDRFQSIVMGMLNAIRSGESELCRATSLSSPLLEVLSRVQKSPSQLHLRALIEITRTDLNNRTAQEMERVLHSQNAFDVERTTYQFPLLRGIYLGG